MAPESNTAPAGFRYNSGLQVDPGAKKWRQLPSFQAQFRGTEPLETSITQGSRRLSLACGMGAALMGAAMAAGSEPAPRWLALFMGGSEACSRPGSLLEPSRIGIEKSYAGPPRTGHRPAGWQS
jgi:hypothetical protein